MRTKKLLVLLLISFGVIVILWTILQENGYEWKETLQISFLSGMLLFLTGMVFEQYRIREERAGKQTQTK